MKICTLYSLDHATSFQDFFRTLEGTVKYGSVHKCYTSSRMCLIQLASFYLRCYITFKGTNEYFKVDSESIAKAEKCLKEVLERWEGISSRNEGKYLLTKSDLHLRKKQYHKVLEFGNEVLQLCVRRNQEIIAGWAGRRIVYLESRIGVNGVDVDRSDVSSGCEAGPSSGVESG